MMTNEEIIKELENVKVAINQLSVSGVQNCNIISFIDVSLGKVYKALKPAKEEADFKIE